MRLIDADALMECFKGWIEEYNLSPAYVRAIIDEMPTISPKTGRWGSEWFDHKLKLVCSACGCFADKMTYYCPNCGARMEEVTE